MNPKTFILGAICGFAWYILDTQLGIAGLEYWIILVLVAIFLGVITA